MLPTEDSLWVGEESAPPFRPALLAIHAHRYRRQPFRHPPGARKSPAPQNPRLPLLLSRHRRRNVSSPFTMGWSDPRRGNIGPPVDPAVTTQVVEFNDLQALEAGAGTGRCRLRAGRAGHDQRRHNPSRSRLPNALRELTRKLWHASHHRRDPHHLRRAGRLHAGGWNLDPDFSSFGKTIAGGIPGAAYGFTEEVAKCIAAAPELEDCDTGGIGGTLAGNALSLAAMRATLEQGPTPEAFARMIPPPIAGRRRRESRSPNSACPGTSPGSVAAPNISLRRNAPRNGAEGAGRDGLRTRVLHASLRHESRHPAHALPQHGPDVAPGRSRRCRSAYPRLPRSGQGVSRIACPRAASPETFNHNTRSITKALAGGFLRAHSCPLWLKVLLCVHTSQATRGAREIPPRLLPCCFAR